MSSFISLQNIIYPSNELSLTMILLDEWCCVHVTGSDSKEYLQNQFTIDMNFLLENHHMLSAHCNINGKVWSTMHVFHYNKGYLYIQRKSVSIIQIRELQKYAIFSKVKINELDNIYLIGIAGFNARLFLSKFFKKIPDKNCPVVYENKKVILWFSKPLERFLLVFNLSDFLHFKKIINQKIFFNNNRQWLSLDIESGFPIIDKKSSKQFTPQAINLDKIKAISFKKGCYYGQETIARIFFKKLNKYFLSVLIGKGTISPKIGSIIETNIDNMWYKIGFLLAIVQIKNEEIWIQVVLYKSINENSLFRIYGFKNIFLIKDNN